MKLEIEVPDGMIDKIGKEEIQKMLEFVMTIFPLIEGFAFKLEQEKK